MARRDVDLVIKARDQAASVVKSITDALSDFVDAQQNLEGRAGKTESTLTKLGASIGKLDVALKGLSAGEAIANELLRAENALDRLEKKFAETEQEAAGFGKSLQQADAALARYTNKLAGAAAAQERQQQSLKALKENQKDLTFAYEQAVASQDKLSKRQKELPGLIDRASTANQKAVRIFGELSAKMAATEAPSARLQERFEQNSRSVATTSDKLKRLQQEYAQIGGRLEEAGRAVTLFAEKSERASNAVTKQESALKKIGQNYSELKTKAGAAATNQGKLRSELERTANVLAQSSVEIAKARGEYAKLGASADQAKTKLDQLAQSGLKELETVFKGQRRAVLEAKQAYVQARDEATRLGAAISKVKTPSAEMVSSFDRAKVVSAQLKGELIQQRSAYQQLGTVLRGTTASIDGVRSSQLQFATIQRELSASLARSGAAARDQVASIARLSSVSSSAAGNARNLANAQQQAAAANERAASSTSRLAAAYRAFYGDTRRSLSLLQRIRGEVLSLAASYGGLFAGIQAIKGTVDATQQLEAATARLSVAFNEDDSRVASELDFLRRTAQRLGVEFGVLSTEYSKFNIAAQGTALEGEKARKIFVQVAEAARVNRSSTKDLSGVFVALTQIVSKGAVQMEELRQQLGDRLPGAIKIMADGLGVGTAELIKMMEQGEITEEALVSFGDELERRFGGGLEESLKGLTTSLGRLKNAAFQALVQFGQGGFNDSFKEFADTLTETLDSADFESFSKRMSSALGALLDFLGFLGSNFQLVIASIVGFLTLRLTPVVLAIAGHFRGLTLDLAKAATGFTAVQARAAAMGVTVTRTGYAVRALTRFLQSLLATTGVGLAFVAISTAISFWATNADKATEALNAHRKIVDQVKDAYEAVGGAVDLWQKKLQDLTTAELEGNLDRIKDALGDVQSEFDSLAQGDRFLTNFFGFNISFEPAKKYVLAIKDIRDQFRSGQIDSKQFITALDEATQKYGDGSKGANKYAEELIAAARSEVAVTEASKEANAALAARNGTLAEAVTASEELGVATKDVKNTVDEFTKSYEKLSKAAADIADGVPKAATKTDEAAAAAEKLATAYEDALAAARALPEAIQRAAAEQQVYNTYAGAMADLLKTAGVDIDKAFDQITSGTEAAAKFLRQKEGFRSAPYDDGGTLRAGFGSDTRTLADGTVEKIVAGMTVTLQQANDDLARRLSKEFVPAVARAVGQERFDSLLPTQQAALVSLAYNYGAAAFDSGKILSDVAKAVRAGDFDSATNAILARAGDNGGINRGRRVEEAALFQSQAGIGALTDDYQDRLDAEKEFRETLQDELETLRQQTAVQNEGIIAQETQKAIREAELKAKKEGVQLTKEERAEIEKTVAAKFAAKQLEEEQKLLRERAVEAEQKVNALLEQRRAIDAQLQQARKSGDTAQVDALTAQLAKVNAALEESIIKAKEFWKALGGADAETALIKLDTAGLKAETLAAKATTVYLQWDRVGDLFVNGLAGAFDTFAKAVANGENAFTAARDAFLKFASDFLLEIARMIIKQAIFNALQSAFGGTPFGNLIGVGAGHTGGLVGTKRVGSGNQTRRVNPAVFAGAMRFHQGGLAGLRPGEVPIIAKENEEILDRDNPRHMFNAFGGGGGGGGAGKGLTLINAVDGSAAMDQALSESAGQEVLINFMRSRKNEIVQVLGLS